MNAIRDQFPIFAAQPAPFHYLDNAATGQICRAAAEALWRFETTTRANVKRGVYRLADEATNAFQHARGRGRGLYRCRAMPTRSCSPPAARWRINTAAHALSPRLRPGDEILVSELEHHSNSCRGRWRPSVPVRASGPSRSRTKGGSPTTGWTSSCPRAPGSSPSATPPTSPARWPMSAALRDAAAAVGAVLLLDGAQRAPHGPIDVRQLGCDLYAFSAHKMFGPTGAGALWGRKELLAELPPFLGGGEMIRRVEIERSSYAEPPHRFEAGTPAIGPAIGMGAAAAWLGTLDWQALGRQEIALTGRMLDGLGTLPGVRVQGPLGSQARLGVVSFTVDGVHPHDVCQMLDEIRRLSARRAPLRATADGRARPARPPPAPASPPTTTRPTSTRC